MVPASGLSPDGALFFAIDLDAIDVRDVWRRHSGEIAITSLVRARLERATKAG